MKKAFKRISLIALSALMVGSATASFASCTSNIDEVIDVFIFAGDSDQETNTDMINAWAESYAQKLIASGEEEGFTIQTNPTFQSDTDKYFSSLTTMIAAGTAPDIFYVSPKYVKAYSKQGYVLDLTDYVDFSNYEINEVFGDALGFYAYDGQTIGSEVTYDSTQGKFINAEGNIAGLYGLPKDYSSFGLGYNANFFTDALKTAYATTAPVSDDTKAINGGSIITNASTGAASKGIINIGEPTRYYPYNFYLYSNYTEALSAGDPVALASQKNGGYVVTLPGYPGETFAMQEDEETAYDSSYGYITYTYAEFGAISWAICYYYNKYMPDHARVYANDQYEGVLYLLPWLAGNDSDYINSQTGTKLSDGSTVAPFSSVEAGTYTNSDGTVINYGIDNEEFIETYAAFASYGSDWNGNSYYAGDGLLAGGYASFKEGNVLFYGVGTWDAAGFDECSPDVLSYAVMPEPVSEDYAIYSVIKDANYNPQQYTYKGTKDSDGKDASVTKPAKASYTQAEIIANQIDRQDQWKARMDSVGYGVNGNLKKADDWFVRACADLVATLTLDRDSQVELTLSGSQIPNYKDMCIDYLNAEGSFAGIITPDLGTEVFQTYYNAAKALYDQSSKDITVAQYMAENFPTLSYNPSEANTTLKKINTYVKAYRALNIITLDKVSRNLAVRMVAGENGVKDSCMYTFSSAWIDVFSANKAGCLIAYADKKTNTNPNIHSEYVNNSTLCTPYAYCNYYVADTQVSLNQSLLDEKAILGA